MLALAVWFGYDEHFDFEFAISRRRLVTAYALLFIRSIYLIVNLGTSCRLRAALLAALLLRDGAKRA